MLNGQRTSLDEVFGDQSFTSDINNASPILNEIGTNLGESVAEIDQVTPLMQTMYAAGSIFDGAGTILSSLIMMAGPGIITTLFDLIGSKILDFLITPLLNQIPVSI